MLSFTEQREENKPNKSQIDKGWSIKAVSIYALSRYYWATNSRFVAKKSVVMDLCPCWPEIQIHYETEIQVMYEWIWNTHGLDRFSGAVTCRSNMSCYVFIFKVKESIWRYIKWGWTQKKKNIQEIGEKKHLMYLYFVYILNRIKFL